VILTRTTKAFPMALAFNPTTMTLYVLHRDQPAVFVVEIIPVE
jgi:hypothetical protein